MATPGTEATRGVGGPARGLPIVVIAMSIVAVAMHYDGFGPAELPLPRVTPVFDVRKNAVYVGPMDPDVRANAPGTCRRCGMALRAGIPDPVEFHLDLTAMPSPTGASSRCSGCTATARSSGIHSCFESRSRCQPVQSSAV